MLQTKLRLSVLLFLVGILTGISQTNSSNEEIINNSRSISSFDSRSKSLKGSVYIIDEFLPAKISNNDKIFSIRYNVYQDEMEMEKDGSPYYLPKSFGYTVSFSNNDRIYQVFSLETKNGMEPNFFLVLMKGEKVSLLAKERIKLEDAVEPKSGYDKYKPPTLKRIKNKYYIGFSNFSTTELPSKKKEFLKLFSSNAKEVENHMKSNKLNFKKEDDLIKIFKFFNTL